MASVTKKKNTWYAIWRGLDGRTVMRTTKIKVAYAGKSKKQTKRVAMWIAEVLEQLAKNSTTLDEAIAEVRKMAVCYDFGKYLPVIEEYLHNFPAQASSNLVQDERSL